MSVGRVYIGEDFDDEFGFLSGRFSAHWESNTEPVRVEEGPNVRKRRGGHCLGSSAS